MPEAASSNASPAEPVTIRALDARGAEARVAELGAILVDAVAHGASVNFMAGLSAHEAEAFWMRVVPGLAAGTHILLVAQEGGRLIGTVLVGFAPQPNAPHRAEVSKMLVHSSARRRGIGARLLAAAESAARAAGRTLLLLDTQSGSAGDHLYRRCGWTPFGEVPDHAFTPDGRLAPTTFFYKRLDEAPA